ncbi:MAG TPA: ribosome small subunit-dependent GTPase A [candidate division Zixibacteria bacterium]|nr:ribosome small subunit-dependent GTPase A [candidate division Zixibacteria bacterium]
MQLFDLGWNDYFSQQFEKYKINSDIKKEQNTLPARVSCEHRNLYHVISENGDLTAEISGRFRHEAGSRADFPVVGDWVVITPHTDNKRSTIHAVLPRQSFFSRKAILGGGPKYGMGKTEEQVLVANINSVFLVSGLDNDFNLRRIERYLTIAWDSGATPVVVLNKSDLSENTEEQVEKVEEVAPGVPIYPVSAKDNEGLDALMQHIGKGQTVTFLGSSGVGKSSIINCLLGEDLMKVGNLRKSDGRGRHTTTYRELLILPDGGIVIDTPGIRELQIWTDEKGLEKTFGDIEQLAKECKFKDCSHETEPGCAIQKALKDGTLDKKRYQGYLKLQKELTHLKIRQDQKETRRVNREWDKKVRRYHKDMKELRKKGLA